MSELELNNSVSLEDISNALNEQYILGDEGDSEFAYLASLALELHDEEDSDVEDVLVEFLRESPEFDHIDEDGLTIIETVLSE